MNDKVKLTLDSILKDFKSGDIGKPIAYTYFMDNEDAPCSKWSFKNKLLVARAECLDARGFKQWQTVGRKVRKGAKAIYILAPLKMKISNKKNKEDKKE